MSGGRRGPDSRTYQRAAGTLERVADGADKAVGSVDQFTSRLAALPGRIDATLEGTATSADKRMQQEFEQAALKLKRAIGELTHAAQMARAEAAGARQAAVRAEREESQARGQGGRR